MTAESQKCTCGSGEKYKNCCAKKKPAFSAILMRSEKETRITDVKFGPNGEVQLFDGEKILHPDKAWIAVGREREKGEKSLLRVPINPENLKHHKWFRI